MIVNEEGIQIIKHFEGWSSRPYLDPVGIPTIGYGSIYGLDGKRVTMGHREITEEEGEFLLRRHLSHVRLSIGRQIKVPLTENMFSALASWAYNVGTGNMQTSTLRMKLNREDYLGAAEEFPKWRRSKGKILNGLVRRRKREQALFVNGID